jgi:hypothetical protein
MINLFFFKKNIINLIVNFFVYITNINLYFLNKDKKRYFYNHSLGFGDSFIYYLRNYKKIYNRNNFALSFGFATFQSISFFFPKKKIRKILIPLPQNFYYRTVNILKKSKNFKPKIFGTVLKEYQFNNTVHYKNLIINSLKKFKISGEIKKLTKNRYVCLFIKHYNDNPNDISGASIRQTANLDTIKKIFFFLKKKNINTVVLGLDSDKSVEAFKNFVKKNNLKENVFFLNSISKNYLIQDQVYIAEKSIGYIGSTSGPATLFYFLRKKIIILNCPNDQEIPHGNNPKLEMKFIKYLYKYIKYKKKKIILKTDLIKNYNSSIYETSLIVIKKNINNFLLKNK